jgi:hypothetical protein
MENKIKSFWERPEGTTGMITLAGLGVGVFFLLKLFGGAILGVMNTGIEILGKGITLTIMGAFLAALLYVVTNSKFQNLMRYIFKSIMRAITGTFIEIDPIGIMKGYVDDLKKKLLTITDSIAKLNGQIKILERQISENSRNASIALQTAKVAQEQGKTAAFTLNARKNGRFEKSNETLGNLLATLKLHYRALNKYKEASEITIEDIQSEVEVKEKERIAIRASWTAMKAARAILKGDDDARELFNQAMEYTAADYGNKLGEIESFMENSQSFIETLDLTNGVYEADALDRIKQWEDKADSILLGDQKRIMIEQHTAAEYIPGNLNQLQQNDYSQFFGKK